MEEGGLSLYSTRRKLMMMMSYREDIASEIARPVNRLDQNEWERPACWKRICAEATQEYLTPLTE